MSTFTDLFDRADGPIGPNWGVSNVDILSGRAHGTTTNGWARCLAIQSAGAQDVTITYSLDSALALYHAPIVKYATDGTGGYMAYLSGSSGAYQANIFRYTGGGYLTLASNYTPVVLGASTILRLVYSSGNLFLYLDGVLRAQAQDTLYDANVWCGFRVRGSTQGIDSFQAGSATTTAFSVSPSWAQTSGDPIVVSFSGIGTLWTPGVPGAPTFTASAGTLADQSVSGLGSASATFTPPGSDQTVIITDPSTALTDTIVISGDVPPSGGGFAPLLTPEGAATINRAAAIPGSQTVATDLSVIIPGALGNPDLTLLNAISDIWYAHYATWAGSPPAETDAIGRILWNIANGSVGPFVGPFPSILNEPLAETLGKLNSYFYDPIELSYVTTPQLLAAILAIGTPDLSQIRADIGIEGQGTYTSLVDLLLQMWGMDTPTLTQIATMISDLATIAGYDLGDVLDAIAALPTADGAAIMHKLDHIQPNESVDLTTIDAKINHVDATTDALATSLAAMRTGSNLTLQDILDAIAAIPGGGPGGDYLGAPVWPGLAGATLGSSVALSDGMVISGPLHGLLFQVTVQPAKAGKYQFGTVASWSHVGGVIFTSDNSYSERAQHFGLDAHLICPKEMRVASSATVRLNANWGGTVRPFTIT